VSPGEPALARAKARLDALDLYPEAVRVEGVRVVVLPVFFRLPKLRRYRGYALWKTILLRDAGASEDLLTHELCHIWQGQHHRLHMLWAYATTRYSENPYEREARWAVEQTRPTA
jgi:hypothetical protein